MKIALLSDIHANFPALSACLAHATDHGAEQFAILGDMVGYGPHPNEVLDCCRELQAAGAVVLRGNHEDMALSPPADRSSMGAVTAVWTHNVLSETNFRWLKTLPLSISQGTVCFVHASADAPEKWRYVDNEIIARMSLDAACADADIRYVFGGHVHHQSLYYTSPLQGLMAFSPAIGVPIPVPSHRRWLATIGSAGQPRDGDPRAAYAMFDDAAKTLTFHRVDYDHGETAQAIEDAGLPEALARRLERGR